MGLMRFHVAHRNRLPSDVLPRSAIIGPDGLPWNCHNWWEEDSLVVSRQSSDSGILGIPWLTSAFGEMVLPTCTVIEAGSPYSLEAELARGAIYQLRRQISTWEPLGLRLSDSFSEQLHRWTHKLARAVTGQHDRQASAAEACEVIDGASLLGEEMAKTYAGQAIEVRRHNGASIPTLLGVRLGPKGVLARVGGELAGTFDVAFVKSPWNLIEASEGERNWSTLEDQSEWCKRASMKVGVGPILSFSQEAVPQWMHLWHKDFDSILGFVTDHVRAVAQKMKGRTQMWNVASRVNSGQFLGLDPEQRLRLVVRALDVLREERVRGPVIVGFDQPWSEYVYGRGLDLGAIHFADALVRADLGLSGLALELNFGYYPRGTWHRGPIALSRMLDKWSTLGLPLMLEVCTASQSGEDKRAAQETRVLRGEDAETPSPSDCQTTWIDRMMPIMFAKNCVQAVLWNQLDDGLPHEFPFGGLFDVRGEPKPALDSLRRVRHNLLS